MYDDLKYIFDKCIRLINYKFIIFLAWSNSNLIILTIEMLIVHMEIMWQWWWWIFSIKSPNFWNLPHYFKNIQQTFKSLRYACSECERTTWSQMWYIFSYIVESDFFFYLTYKPPTGNLWFSDFLFQRFISALPPTENLDDMGKNN